MKNYIEMPASRRSNPSASAPGSSDDVSTRPGPRRRMAKPKPVQFVCDAEFAKALKDYAAAESQRAGRNVSMSEVIRRALDAHMDAKEGHSASIEPVLLEVAFQLRAAGRLLNQFCRDLYFDRFGDETVERIPLRDFQMMMSVFAEQAEQVGKIIEELKR